MQSNFSSQNESQIQHFECHDYGQTSLGQTCQKYKWEQAHVCSSISIRQYYILLSCWTLSRPRFSRAISSFVSGAVLQITRAALYCMLCSSFFSVLPQLPHTVQQYLNRDSTSELYSFFNASTGRKRANLMPEIADEIFLHISCTCLFHFNFSSNVRPTCLILDPLVFTSRSGHCLSLYSVANIMHLVFSTLMLNLLASSQL